MDHKKILIIDDDKDSVDILKSKLESIGYSVISASTGAMGLAIVRTEKPNLIILDVVMPEMNGFEVCDYIKKDPVTSNIPVIMLTSMDQGPDIEIALEKKADWYIAKPYDDKYLFSKIDFFLNQYNVERT